MKITEKDYDSMCKTAQEWKNIANRRLAMIERREEKIKELEEEIKRLKENRA